MIRKLKIALATSLLVFPQFALADEAVPVNLGAGLGYQPICSHNADSRWRTLPNNPFTSQIVADGSSAVVTASVGGARFSQLRVGDIVAISGAQGFYHIPATEVNGLRLVVATAFNGSNFQFLALTSRRINENPVGGGNAVRVRKICQSW